MGFSTFPNNPFPPSSAQFDEGKNELATKTNLSNIAPAFDATSGVYAVGDKVIYNGVLYEFTSAHSTAGEWDESEVQSVKISELIDSLKSGLTNLITTPSANHTKLGHGAIDGSNAVTVSLGANNISDYDFLWIGTSYYDSGVATYGCTLVPSILMSILYNSDAGVCLIAMDVTTDRKPIAINAVYDSTNNNIRFMPEDTPTGNYYFVIGVKIRSVS